MATTKIWAVKDNLKRVINYATNPDKTETDNYSFDGLSDVLDYSTNDFKTEKQLYVSGINCHPKTAFQEMVNTKKSAGKEDDVLAFHCYQSFKPGEVDAPTAHQIGVELANLMWGKEFEVVVSTHLDKEHLHNHFVVNSVSFITKKRFINRHSDYRKFKQLSDALCHEHSLSVIETYKSGMHYAEWKATKSNKPTKRSVIIEDVETAISNSTYWKQFIDELEKMNYEIKYGKHIAIRQKGSEKYFRLYKLTSDEKYSEANIRARLVENSIVPMQTVQKAKTKIYYKGNLTKAKKLKGFKALYFRYLYLLGVIPKRSSKRRSIHPSLKEDLLKIDQYSKQIYFLSKHQINTHEKLDLYKESLMNRKDELINQRKVIYGKIKRCNDSDLKDELNNNRIAFSNEIKSITEEIKICENIQIRTEIMKMKIKNIRKESNKTDKSIKHKEKEI